MCTYMRLHVNVCVHACVDSVGFQGELKDGKVNLNTDGITIFEFFVLIS